MSSKPNARPSLVSAIENSWMHNLLPAKAQAVLKQAAAVDGGVPIGKSKFRIDAIDRAVKQVRAMAPHCFGIGNPLPIGRAA